MSSTFKHNLGLSLSGGGYRAAAFHLGTLKKMNEMGLLQKVDVLSTISGGSITGAYYCLNASDFNRFEDELYKSLQTKNVVKQFFLSSTFLKFVLFVLIFLVPAFYFLITSKAWLFLLLLTLFIFLFLKFQFYFFPISKSIENIYDNFFYAQKCLGELPDKPILVIGATNLQTGRPFTFSKTWMNDSTYYYMEPKIEFKEESFPIARAVMASSCVPFAFTPVKIDKEFFKVDSDAHMVHPLLVDGGVYDNQGIHKITQSGSYCCNTVITSDAGGEASGELSISNTISLLISTVDIFMTRIKRSQMVEDVYENKETVNRQIAYLSLAWDAEKCIPGFVDNLIKNQITDSVIKALGLKQEWVNEPKNHIQEITEYLKIKANYNSLNFPNAEEKKIARTVGTNLTSLSKTQVDCLMKQAECLTELQVKLYCPSLLNETV